MLANSGCLLYYVVVNTEYLTPEEVAKIMKVHENTIYRWLNTKLLKGIKIGGLWRILREDLPKK